MTLTLGVVLGGALDPMSALYALQAQLRDASATQREQQIEGDSARAESEDRQRIEMLAQAEKAAKKALGKMRPWVRKLVGGIITAVGAVASIFAGAGAAVVAVGVILLAAGDILNGMVERGLIRGEKAQMAVQIVAAALKLVGAIVMSVASGGSSTGDIAANAAQIAAIASQVASDVQDTVATVTAAIDIHDGVREFQASNYRLIAEQHAVESEEAADSMEEGVDELEQLQQRFLRVVRRLREAISAREQAAQAVLATPV